MKLGDRAKRDYFDKSGQNVVFSLRLDEEVYRIIKLVAEEEHRSINAQLTDFIEGGLIQYLDNHQD